MPTRSGVSCQATRRITGCDIYHPVLERTNATMLANLGLQSGQMSPPYDRLRLLTK